MHIKNFIKSSTLLLIGFIITFTSCKKDDTTPAPTITVNDGVQSNEQDINVKSVNLKVKVVAGNGRTIKNLSIERAISGSTNVVNIYSAIPDKAEVDYTYTDDLTGLVSAGSTLTYTIKATDIKNVTVTKVYSVKFIITNGIIASGEIKLGAQKNINLPYKFLGISNNFAAYTAGSNGTAKINSSKIDFVYYYGSMDSNTFAAPTNADGAQVIWDSEIASWQTKNDTKFKTTGFTVEQFNFIKDNSKVDGSFANIDFTSGATSKVPMLDENNIIAFQTASGKKGLIKFVMTAEDNTDAITLFIIAQD